jgi:hypothetical protein
MNEVDFLVSNSVSIGSQSGSDVHLFNFSMVLVYTGFEGNFSSRSFISIYACECVCVSRQKCTNK